MAKVYVFLANGFEDVEALIPVDVLRRGGVEVVTVSVTGSLIVETAHRVKVVADVQFEDIDTDDADLLLLPGGMPGASNLNNHEGVRQALLRQDEQGKRVAAICAAPLVLGGLGLLNHLKRGVIIGHQPFRGCRPLVADHENMVCYFIIVGVAFAHNAAKVRINENNTKQNCAILF